MNGILIIILLHSSGLLIGGLSTYCTGRLCERAPSGRPVVALAGVHALFPIHICTYLSGARMVICRHACMHHACLMHVQHIAVGVDGLLLVLYIHKAVT